MAGEGTEVIQEGQDVEIWGRVRKTKTPPSEAVPWEGLGPKR